jgi:hypothetical protein
MGEETKKPVKEKNLTTTKQVLYLVLIVWLSSLIFSCICYWTKGTFPSSLMDKVNTVAVPTILGYTVRSSIDFVVRTSKNGVTVEKK